MRGALVAVLAAGLMLGALLVSASGAERPARARASAAAATIGGEPQLAVAAHGAGDAQKRTGPVGGPGLQASSAEAAARTNVRAGKASATAYAVARSVDVFDGLVTAYGVRRDVTASGGAAGRISGLHIDGRMIGDVTAARTYDLADGAGTVFVNRDDAGLRVVLAQPTHGYPAGSEVRVAIATAGARDAQAAPVATPTPTVTPTPTPTPRARHHRKHAKKPPVRKITAEELARVTAPGFTFPVFGHADVADDFGGPREIGPHQGNDVFAEFGSPIVAVAAGTLSKVGTLPIAGNRLWLTTAAGDAFFYAHLSAFSPAAVEGAHVKAGTVLGYVGNTGDAEPTPPHLHFEVHPGGEPTDAVDPHAILLNWQGRAGVTAGADPSERPGALVAVRDFIAE